MRYALLYLIPVSVLLVSCGLPLAAPPPTVAVPTVGASPTAAPTNTAVPVAVATPTVAPSPTATPAPVGADWLSTRPNELGKIMILEYHLIGDEEDRWTRSYENFWGDLQRLYREGYRPIGLHDLIDNRIDIPAGTSPVVLTFDDSSPMQFRLIAENGTLKVDPVCAVGMLERFHAQHPDFPLKATFYVLPAADPPHNLFGQDEYQQKKLQYLVERGFEIGNHTFWHQRLDTLESHAEVAGQLGRAVKVIRQMVPGYDVRTLALPLGMHPQDPTWAIEGAHEGTAYHHEMILLASGGPAVPPDHRDFDPYNVPRIQATSLELDFESVYLDYFLQFPEERYVSDGNPDVVAFPKEMAPVYQPAPNHRQLDLPPEVGVHYRAVRLQ